MIFRGVMVLAALAVIAANRRDQQVIKVKPGRLSPDAAVGDIPGYYTCKGKEAGGKTYSGVAVISRKNDLYIVQWMIGTGATFTGVGIRQGNTLAVSWALPADKGIVIRGINLYKIEPGPRLVGRWASIPGPGVVQSETLTFLKRLEESGEPR